MGQGSIEYRGQLMVNCRENYSSYIGEKLAELAANSAFSPLASTAILWNAALEAPPGCSSIDLDSTISDDLLRQLLVDALREILANSVAVPITDKNWRDLSMFDETVTQIILFLEHGEQALAEVFRPVRPADRGAT
jgi:hypothetical protein